VLAVRQGPVGQSRQPAARLVVDTFARAIATSDFEPRLQLVEARWLMQFIGLRWPK
jgi:hypothetical protein